ncbi:No apical meristem (NAM) protein [Corchorus olitorius]|uniref:No apical meristem (NAM) protein n=1 Tax=Corchorus olitorius TaxID=93759 RepID=A0A1R3K216_9ROSI|nr:No apical meristem (NAM) protein [Corchorus olitorius]
MSSVPHSFRFKPAAEEIFKYYLCPAMKGDFRGVLRECDVYEREPWHLFDKDPSQSFWVLTPLKRMSENKIQRTAGSGVWNGRGTVKKVRDSDGKVVGLHKFYNFIDTKTDGSNPNRSKPKPKPKGDHEWNMNEYSLDEKGLNDPVLAVCEITYKPKPPSSSSPPCVIAAVESEPEIFNNNLNSDRKRDRLSSVSVDDPTPNPLKKPRLDQTIGNYATSSSHDQAQTSSSHDHDQTQAKCCCHDDDTDDHDEFIHAILANSSPPRFEWPEIQPLAQLPEFQPLAELPDVETTFGNTSVDDHFHVIGSHEFQRKPEVAEFTVTTETIIDWNELPVIEAVPVDHYDECDFIPSGFNDLVEDQSYAFQTFDQSIDHTLV